MPAFMSAAFGALALFLAGFIRGGLRNSADPELIFGASYALGGLGLMSVLAAGVALGASLTKR